MKQGAVSRVAGALSIDRISLAYEVFSRVARLRTERQ